MEYILAFQLLCGLFASFLAARKGRDLFDEEQKADGRLVAGE